jgi:glutamyl-tRNA synthetase
MYAHLPMILGPDGAKLSKRHGAVDIRDYREQGYLPAAMLNYLVRLGWSHGDQEVFSIAEMIQHFDIADVNQSASSFNPEKLAWLNQQHIINAPAGELGDALRPYLELAGAKVEGGPDPADVADVFRERAETLSEMAQSALYCYTDFDEIDEKAAKKNLRPVVLEPLQAAREQLDALGEWTPAAIENVICGVAESFEINMGKLGQPIRVAVTGGSVSPPIDSTVWLIGKDRVIKRLDHALELVKIRAESS